MINSEAPTKEEIEKNQIEEEMENDSLLAKDELKQNFRDKLSLLEEVTAIRNSRAYALIEDGIDKLYQEAFREAYSTDNAYKTKYGFEKMKGISSTLKVIDNLIIRLNDDVEFLAKELEETQENN